MESIYIGHSINIIILKLYQVLYRAMLEYELICSLPIVDFFESRNWAPQ